MLQSRATGLKNQSRCKLELLEEFFMSGNFLSADEITQLAKMFVEFEQQKYPEQPAKTLEEYIQIINADMEMIAPYAVQAAPILLEIQRVQSTRDDGDDILPEFFDSDTYYRSVLS